MGRDFCFRYSLLSRAVTGLYSVAVFVFGQQPELVAADIPAMGQPLGAASPAQHGLVQSGGQSFGQQHLSHSSGQQQFSHSSGQHFGGQQPSSDCPGLFCAGQQPMSDCPGLFCAKHPGVCPVAWQALTCEPVSEPKGKMFA